MSKSIRLFVLVTLFVTLTVAALLPVNSSSSVPTAEAQDDPVVVRIFVGVGTGYRPYQQEVQVALAERWNSTHDDIKVEFEFHDNETARNELLTQVAGGDYPAIVGPAGVRSVFETSDLWADIGEYIERDADELNLDDYDASSFDLYELGDRTIALPFGIYPSFMLVNETIFEEAEVELPPLEFGAWTWDDLRDRGIAVTQDANGNFAGEDGFDPENIEIYGYVPFWSNFRGSTILFGPENAGVEVGDDGSVTATFDQPAILEASQFFHDGIFVDHFIPNADAEGALGEGVTNPFSSGRIAMAVSHTWLFSGLQASMDDGSFTDSWNIYPVPSTADGQTIARLHADTFAIMDGFEDKDAAWEVLKWLNSPEIALELNSVYGAMPARLSIRNDWEALWLEAFPFLNIDVVYGAVEFLDAPNHEGYMPNFARSWDALEGFWATLRSDPDLDVAVGLSEVNAEVQTLFDEGDE